jgi:hypothetical protein
MRSSDVELSDVAAARIMKQNDTAVFKDVVDYRNTVIDEKPLARTTDPFAELADAEPVANGNRSVGTDGGKRLCYCCGNLGGVSEYNKAHRKNELI